MHPMGNFVEEAFDLHYNSFAILSDLAYFQQDSSSIIESLSDLILSLLRRIFTFSRISVDLFATYPPVDPAEVSEREPIFPPTPVHPNYPVLIENMYAAAVPFPSVSFPREFMHTIEQLSEIEKIIQNSETPLRDTTTYFSDHERDLMDKEVKGTFRTWWGLSKVIRSEMIRSTIWDIYHTSSPRSIQDPQFPEKIAAQGQLMTSSVRSTIHALAYTQQMKIHPERLSYYTTAFVDRILEPLHPAIDLTAHPAGDNVLASQLAIDFTTYPVEKEDLSTQQERSMLKGPGEGVVIPGVMEMPAASRAVTPRTGRENVYSIVPLLTHIAYFSQGNPFIQAFNSYTRNYQELGENIPSMFLQTNDYRDGSQNLEHHNLYEPHSVSSIISNPMEIYLNLSEAVSKEFSYSHLTSPKIKDRSISVSKGEEKTTGAREQTKDFKAPKITLDLPPFIPIKRTSTPIHQVHKDGLPSTHAPDREVPSEPASIPLPGKPIIPKEISSIMNQVHESSRIDQFTNKILSPVMKMHHSRAGMMHTYNSIVSQGMPGKMTEIISDQMSHTLSPVSNIASENYSSRTSVIHLLESAMSDTPLTTPYERGTGLASPPIMTIARDLRPPTPATIFSHPAINVSGFAVASPNQTIPQQNTERHSVNHFQNTFNIAVQIKNRSDEAELRELGKKIGTILSEEIKRYGGVI